jgi:hypothetical protein
VLGPHVKRRRPARVLAHDTGADVAPDMRYKNSSTLFPLNMPPEVGDITNCLSPVPDWANDKRLCKLRHVEQVPKIRPR